MCPNTIVDLDCAAGPGAAPPAGEAVGGLFVSTVALGPAPREAPAPGDAVEPLGEPTGGAVTGKPALFEATGVGPPTFESAVPATPGVSAGTAAGASVESAWAEAPGLLSTPASGRAVP
jgi:hypothetical protein